MLAFALGSNVQIGGEARSGGRLHRVGGVLGGQLLALLVDLGGGQVAQLDPADLAGLVAHADEAAVFLQHLDALAVLDLAHLLINGRDLVAQEGLLPRDVGVLLGLADLVAAACGQQAQQHACRYPSPVLWLEVDHRGTKQYNPARREV